MDTTELKLPCKRILKLFIEIIIIESINLWELYRGIDAVDVANHLDVCEHFARQDIPQICRAMRLNVLDQVVFILPHGPLISLSNTTLLQDHRYLVV